MSDQNTHHVRLVMIVRDEADFIEKCLTSFRHLYDSYTIVDTGSVDDTMAIVERVTKKLRKPGSLHEREWVSHTPNRNEAMNLGRDDGVADYLLLIDGDWT
jgi:glycosyltransferase involved in cell wall biosynthesis